jgi:hypothetical protein
MKPDWQPIDTAPKDGRAVLLLSAADGWDDPLNGPVQRAAMVFIGAWDADGTSWVDRDGGLGGYADHLGVTGVWSVGHGWLQPTEVTHWMPLPEPPRA